jgi:hypothetical protein
LTRLKELTESMGPKKEAKGGIDELWASHARIQQTIARMSESSDELTAAHEANTAHKKRIAEQDARALRMDVEHKKYREGMGRSFSSLQDGIQAFVVQMLDNAAEQLVEAKAASDTHKRFLTERDAGHKDCVRELTESFDAKLAEQIKRSELAEVHTRAELTKSFDAKLAEQIKRAELVEENTRAELTESFGAQLAKQLKRSELAQENTRAQLHLASQELLCFKQDMCLPLAGSECPDMWDERDDAAGCTVETVESINAFLEPYEDAVDDEITRVLAAAACGHKRAIGNACDGGLCAFELQAMVYPNAGAESFTSKAGKALAGQQAGAQARTQQVPWSPPPRELCCSVAHMLLCALYTTDNTDI